MAACPFPVGRMCPDRDRSGNRAYEPIDERTRRLSSLVARISTLMAVAAVGMLLGASPAGAGAVAGTAVITEVGQPTPLNSGGSATPYGVLLPSGASCPGDTAHHGYHVYSYLVPAGVSPATVSFKTGVPSRYYGYISYGSYFGAVNTAQDTGEIVGIPPQFTWSRLTPADLFPHGAKTATWNGGIACANTRGVVTSYWNSVVVFEASATDPGGFTWRVTHPAATTSNTLGLWLGVVLIGAAAGLGAILIVLRRRQSRHATHRHAAHRHATHSNNSTVGTVSSGRTESMRVTPSGDSDLSSSTFGR